MKNLIENFILNMTKEDIIKFANKNNLTLTSSELDFIYNFIKNNYLVILNNPGAFNIEKYKNRFSETNYIFISNLVNKYKYYLK